MHAALGVKTGQTAQKQSAEPELSGRSAMRKKSGMSPGFLGSAMGGWTCPSRDEKMRKEPPRAGP